MSLSRTRHSKSAGAAHLCRLFALQVFCRRRPPPSSPSTRPYLSSFSPPCSNQQPTLLRFVSYFWHLLCSAPLPCLFPPTSFFLSPSLFTPHTIIITITIANLLHNNSNPSLFLSYAMAIQLINSSNF